MNTVDAELEVAQAPAAAAGLELTDARKARVGGWPRSHVVARWLGHAIQARPAGDKDVA